MFEEESGHEHIRQAETDRKGGPEHTHARKREARPALPHLRSLRSEEISSNEFALRDEVGACGTLDVGPAAGEQSG